MKKYLLFLLLNTTFLFSNAIAFTNLNMLTINLSDFSNKKSDKLIKQKESILFQIEQDTLSEQSEEQDRAIRDKLRQGNSFLENYQLQQQLLNLKSQEIKSKERQIFIQDRYLKNQKKLIDQQKQILGGQKRELNNQGRINLLFIIIGVLAITFLGYVVKMAVNRRKLVERLKQKHKEVATKSNTLERQNKELEQFAYIASHDLQEPLHTITSFADFMIEDYSEKIDIEGKDNLKYIKQGCTRMEELIKSLLDYSRIGTQRKLKYIDSKELVYTIVQDFKILIKENEAEINFGSMPMIYAYPVELRMLFQNIISNAIKFKKKDNVPVIFIEGETLKSTLEFSHRWKFKISDNGIGIPNEHQAEIFEIFKRLHTRDSYEGTGIGLAHCKKIILFHHGEIWVNSTVGNGTTFNFTIQFNPEDYIIVDD